MITDEELERIAKQAGETIRSVRRQRDMDVSRKADDSPVTEADEKASDHIREQLLEATPYTYVDEEHGVTDRGTEKWWLVDPLDGTKDFIDGSNEYTVNIALIEDGTPTRGIVHVPATNTSFIATDDNAVKKRKETKKLSPQTRSVEDSVVAVSKSHPDEALQSFLSYLSPGGIRGVGSSLKGCKVAEGSVHVYPRFQRLNMWDIAAMHAVIEASGCAMTRWNGDDLHYDQDKPKMQPFVAAPKKLQKDVRNARSSWRDGDVSDVD